MISLKKSYSYPLGISIVADDLIEFHASRLLLIVFICGSRDRSAKLLKLKGLTKMAKLDFFIRYPEFFRKAAKFLNTNIDVQQVVGGIESRMIRFYYGPWDNRYYQLLPYLESRELIKVIKEDRGYSFLLSQNGERLAKSFYDDVNFEDLVKNIMIVGKAFSKFSGSGMKDLIYKIFQEEVGSKKLGDIIL